MTAGYSGTPLVKKLGIKSGNRIALLHAPERYLELLGELPPDVAIDTELGGAEYDFAQGFFVWRADYEAQFADMKSSIHKNGMLWISWYKKAAKMPTGKIAEGGLMGELLRLEEAQALRETLRREGETLVFTNGHFDLLHAGHLEYLEKARALGDALFVGVNGDASTRRLKGEGRPLVPESQRARLLAALEPVSAVIIFEADTADDLLLALKPEIYAKGGDYADKPLPERAAVEGYGGRVELVEFLSGHSTTTLINRIQELSQKRR